MSRVTARALSLIVFAATFLACDNEPLSEGIARSGAAPQAAVVNDADGIQAVFDAETAAWTAKDAAAFAANYAEDAQFYSPLGALLNGRAAIRAQHAFLFAGPFAGSTQTLSIIDVEFLTGTIAIVHVSATLTGFAALPPGLNPTDPGVLQTLMTYVMVKRANTWTVVAKQITAIP